MKSGQKLKIALIDDSPYIRETIKALLAEEPEYDIAVEAEGIADTLLILSKTPVDLILLDFQLKDGNALQLLKLFQSADITTPVFIFTNYAEERYRIACEELGALGFFDKNKDLFILWDAIESFRILKKKKRPLL